MEKIILITREVDKVEQRIINENPERNVAKSVNGRTMRKKKKSSKVAVVCYIFGLVTGLIIGLLVSVLFMDKNNNDSNSSNVGNEQQIGQGGNAFDEMLEAKGFVIKTPLVDLYYPEKWKKQINVEQVEGDIYKVQFNGKLEKKDEIQLFEIVFGGTEGILLGTLDETEVYLIYNDISFDDTWTEEAQNQVYVMQEESNYVIGMLQKEEGFVPAN